MTTKYKTNRKGAPLHLSILLLFFIALGATGPKTSYANHDLAILIAFCMFLSILFFFGVSIEADDKGIYTIDLFVFKRGMAYVEIQEVWYYPAYITGGRTRIVAIKGSHNGREKIIRLGGNKFFSDETLSDIVFLIKKRNPNAQLDGASEELMRSNGVMLR